MRKTLISVLLVICLLMSSVIFAAPATAQDTVQLTKSEIDVNPEIQAENYMTLVTAGVPSQ